MNVSPDYVSAELDRQYFETVNVQTEHDCAAEEHYYNAHHSAGAVPINSMCPLSELGAMKASIIEEFHFFDQTHDCD